MMRIKGTSTVDTQDLIDMSQELEHFKKKAAAYAQKLAEIQLLIDLEEDEYLEEINKNSFISYPSYISSKAVGNILEIDMESREARWLEVAHKRQEGLRKCTD